MAVKKDTVMISANLDAETKKQAEKIFDSLGLNMTTAINLFLKAVVKVNGVPFPITTDGEALERFKRLSRYHYELNIIMDDESKKKNKNTGKSLENK